MLINYFGKTILARKLTEYGLNICLRFCYCVHEYLAREYYDLGNRWPIGSRSMQPNSLEHYDHSIHWLYNF